MSDRNGRYVARFQHPGVWVISDLRREPGGQAMQVVGAGTHGSLRAAGAYALERARELNGA